MLLSRPASFCVNVRYAVIDMQNHVNTMLSDLIKLRADPELKQSLCAVAAQEKISVSELVRRTLRARVAKRDGASPSGDDPGPFRPAPGQRIAA